MPGKQKKKRKQREDAAHKGKNKCLMEPLKSLGPLGEYPCSPPPPLWHNVLLCDVM